MATKVILQKDVKKLGFSGDVVEVSPGYARNFLFPKGLAVEATPSQIQKAEKLRAEKVKTKAEMQAKADEVIASIASLTLIFAEKVSQEGHLYGSIAEKDIVSKLATDAKITVEKNQIEMPKGHIKEVGDHEVVLHLFEGKTVPLKIKVQEGTSESK